MKLNEMAQRCLSCAIKRGKLPIPEDKRLESQKYVVLGEVAELMRSYPAKSEHIDYNEDIEEAADVIISALTYLALARVDADAVIEAKMSYNEQRED
jgi:NTP pyrophosphatase (non-canonical NTP hydrolase)